MDEPRVAHTAELTARELAAARAMVVEAFAGGFYDMDWEHALGGLHILAEIDGRLAGHASVVQRRLLHGGRALRCGYVEAVAVRPDLRGQGIGRLLMGAVARILHAAYDLGALSASAAGAPLYAACGWQVWTGPLAALTPDGVVATDDEAGGVYVLELAVPLDFRASLTCDWREGDVW